MVRNSLRTLWSEPRPAQPPVRVWRDWALLGVAVAASLVEAGLRSDRTWMPVVLVVSGVVAAAVLWRRTRPLTTVAVAFGTLIVFDVARILASDVTGLTSIAVVLVLPYALLRWGSGREAVVGLGIILVWVSVTLVAVPTTVPETVAGYGFFLFSAALGATVRFHAATRRREIEQAELRQRHELARDLHDTVAHQVSGIAIQAQAGRAVAAAHPERAAEVLAVIEEAASRTLTELRSMVGLLRTSEGADFAPRPGLADLERLAEDAEGGPRIEVELAGELDGLSPAVGAALYRLAQESVTNARRYARDATRVAVRVVGDAEQVQLTVSDDGAVSSAAGHPSGYGLVGMRERAKLLGGTFHAGPKAGGGWRVEATLPHGGVTS